MTDECVAIRTEDLTVVGLSLEDGSERECDAEPTRRPHISDTTTCGIIRMINREGANVTHGDLTYHVHAREPGTPFLIVSAERDANRSGKRPSASSPSGERPSDASSSPGVVVVVGSERGDDDHNIVVGLNSETGTERYAVDLPEQLVGTVRDIYFNGRYVIIVRLGMLLALDPATGETAWSLP